MSVFFLNVCVFAIGHLCETHIYVGEGGGGGEKHERVINNLDEQCSIIRFCVSREDTFLLFRDSKSHHRFHYIRYLVKITVSPVRKGNRATVKKTIPTGSEKCHAVNSEDCAEPHFLC